MAARFMPQPTAVTCISFAPNSSYRAQKKQAGEMPACFFDVSGSNEINP
jgi:hypothetical protein